MNEIIDELQTELSAIEATRKSARRRELMDAYRQCLAKTHAELERLFDGGANVRDIVQLRAHLIDRLLTSLWHGSDLANSPHALVAVGGYGRGELHPYSDVDIAIILGAKLSSAMKKTLETWITFLFDTGLEVGHSVRTVKQSQAAARDDITVMTNLMEARTLCGPEKLLDEVTRLTAVNKIWPLAEFFAAKLEEQKQRHAKFDDAFQQLEPNLKESPGGLRDIQVIAWVATRHFAASDLRGLINEGFLTDEEGRALFEGEEFLWRIRCALHFEANRREDRLLFDHQKSVAVRFGYEDDGSNRAVEHFMKDFYRTVRDLSSLNEMLLDSFREAILEPTRKSRVAPLNRRFQVRNNAIEICYPEVFARTPPALLEIFLLLQQNPSISGIRASTIRELRRNLHLIDDAFRQDLRARSLFMEIIRQPRRIGDELQRMHRYGVLGAYLPVFAAVEGLMQFDLFHIYTVDEHSLFVVRHMRYFSFPRSPDDQIPQVLKVIEKIPKLELLYIAGMFHDIAKGRGGDHSALGAEDAVDFCKSHGLSNLDTHLVAWLVRHHLIMSTTAQSKDIYDLEVVKAFAKIVGDRTHLNYLFLLTVADIRGTNPELWNDWKASLLTHLYVATERVLHRGDNSPLDKDEQVRMNRRESRKLLARESLPEHEINMLWDSLGDNYFLRHRAEEIAWHTAAILATDSDDLPVVSVRSFDERGGTSIFVYEKDIDNLYAMTTAALDNLRLDVLDARIITSQAAYSLDTFTVVDADTAERIEDANRIHEICSKIRGAIRAGTVPNTVSTVNTTRKLKHFEIPVEVNFEYDKVHKCTVMEVIATNRPGLLSKIGRALQDSGVRLHDARIATFGERAEDYFYITTHDNKRLSSKNDIPALKQRVIEALST